MTQPEKRVERAAAKVERCRLALQSARAELEDARGAVKARRICHRCVTQISVSHKWQFVEDQGVTKIAHRNCQKPESYR